MERVSNEKTFSVIFFFGICPSVVNAWPRLGEGASPMFQSSGDKSIPFSVSVGSTTPVKVYSIDLRDREILFQNTDSTYYVHCGTYSTINATAGTPRFLLPPKPSAVTTNATFSIWCVADPLVAGTIEIVGEIERDFRESYVAPY